MKYYRASVQNLWNPWSRCYYHFRTYTSAFGLCSVLMIDLRLAQSLWPVRLTKVRSSNQHWCVYAASTPIPFLSLWRASDLHKYLPLLVTGHISTLLAFKTSWYTPWIGGKGSVSKLTWTWSRTTCKTKLTPNQSLRPVPRLLST